MSIESRNTLADLIRNLQVAVERNKLTSGAVSDAIKKLTQLGHKEYDLDKFPELADTSSFKGPIRNAPVNLAEALLWKLGKWKVYQTFAKNFNNKALKVSKTGGVVLSAFAKHLQDNNNPIYDQHAIRALWAISRDFSKDEKEKCESLLFNGSKTWKDAGSGDDGACYQLYVHRMATLCSKNNIKNDELDRLLMPLGQAIKKSTRKKRGAKSTRTDHDRFVALCWPSDG